MFTDGDQGEQMTGNTIVPASELPADYYTMRGAWRRLWAGKAGRLYVAGVLMLLVIIPFTLAMILPENPEPGFWTDLAKDWIVRGPSTLVAVTIAAFTVLPLMLRRRRRQAQAEDLRRNR